VFPHPKRLGADPKRRGSGLVELMFAAVVLVVGISAAALQSARAHQLHRHTEAQLTATAHLRSVLSSILEQDPAELLAADSKWSPGAVDESADLDEFLPGQRTTVEYPGYAQGDAAPSLLPVVVRVEWDAGRGDVQSLELRSVVKR
jgi:hypothetical protein